MRKVNMGAAFNGNWNPRFKVATVKKTVDRLGRGETSVLAYFPTIKGPRRMERLRRYFHVDMALLLDAWPDVGAWTAETSKVRIEGEDGPFDYTPDFAAVSERGPFVVRLLPPRVRLSERGAARQALVNEHYLALGTAFVVLGAEELLDDPDLPAAKDLFLHRMRDWAEELPETLEGAWGGMCPLPLKAIHDEMGGGQEAWFQLLSLAAFGHLRLDIHGPVVPATTVLSISTTGYRP